MKKKNCYALFIGVDSYDSSSVPNLSGCVKDAEHLASYLNDNFNTDLYTLQLKTLYTGTSTPPTRAAIINSIIDHLGAAKADDTILIFYAGHGSKEKAHPSFSEVDGNLQTLVPCDARMSLANGQLVHNILDKELRFLFHKLWKEHHPELIFIQDSCHSTGATRQAEQLAVLTDELQVVTTELNQETQTEVHFELPVPRFTEPTDYERSGQLWTNASVEILLDTYTAFKSAPEILEQALKALQEGQIPFQNSIPLADHIHLAACDKHEFAYEIPNQGGVFTTHLIEILQASQNTISYQDLFNRIRMNIGGVYKQTPDLFINSADFKKRHELFLGDLLQHGKIPPQRDIDVFKGFYPIVPKGRNSWQIKAGEMELLPSLDGKIKAIPIEVFLQNEQPKGVSNAVIDYVAPGYSLVTFTSAKFDRKQHRNKLYAMIPPQYMRRWRVAVKIDSNNSGASIHDFFEQYPPRKNLKNFQQGGSPAIELTNEEAKADFLLKAEGNWVSVYQKKQILLFKAAAVEYEENRQKRILPFIQKATDSTYYKYKKGTETPLEWDNNYELSNDITRAIPPIFEYLAIAFSKNSGKNITVFCQQIARENAFTQFKKEQEKVVNYYTPFINWTDDNAKAEYLIQTTGNSFVVYPANVKTKACEVPVFKPTIGTSTKDGFKIILALQKMCKWKTVQNLYNKLQLSTLLNHKFEFSFKIYEQHLVQTIDQTPDYNLPHRSITLQSWNNTQFSKFDRGIFKPINALQEPVAPIYFIANSKHASIVLLDLGLAIKHLKGNQNVYISTLLLDSNYGILPLQKSMGNNLLPPQNGQTDGLGILVLNDLKFHQPKQMASFPQKIEEVIFYIKIFIAYQRFDISGFLQKGLPAATLKATKHASSDSGTRAMVQKPPKSEETGSWMSFTIPIIIKQAL